MRAIPARILVLAAVVTAVLVLVAALMVGLSLTRLVELLDSSASVASVVPGTGMPPSDDEATSDAAAPEAGAGGPEAEGLSSPVSPAIPGCTVSQVAWYAEGLDPPGGEVRSAAPWVDPRLEPPVLRAFGEEPFNRGRLVLAARAEVLLATGGASIAMDGGLHLDLSAEEPELVELMLRGAGGTLLRTRWRAASPDVPLLFVSPRESVFSDANGSARGRAMWIFSLLCRFVA